MPTIRERKESFTRGVCEVCGAVFDITASKRAEIEERQARFPEIAQALEQEFHYCEDCVSIKMVALL